MSFPLIIFFTFSGPHDAVPDIKALVCEMLIAALTPLKRPKRMLPNKKTMEIKVVGKPRMLDVSVNKM